MSFALAVLFVGFLMIYCGVKGRSLKNAILGHAVPGSQGQIAGA